ncbi:helix-turn-helix protein [Ulvibacter sp. MAR_2010_11]|uniref:helix-turn-helix domain-containing protein n=1 Tax=Ulvibacter sp. MAR_2010_11 TaxID=1250229 RepID=UPI000C2C7E13|nr:helix-turn-helix domain-containing protein [Ulvibacter sp. MAR_2010_11]PKA83078.1 helix-turn-helix protein [Ulvibacter sp. MAR_2010_11]
MRQPELGKKITELRKIKGLTQEELVAQCNINVRTIQRIEAGEVTPRSYTVRTIFEVLGYDLEELEGETSKTNSEFDRLILPTLSSTKEKRFLISNLKIACIGGIIYFLTGFIEFALDYARFYENELIWGEAGYISLKFIVLGSFIYFIRGFFLLGKVYRNYLLKIGAFLLITINILFYAYDMVSLYLDLFYIEYVLVVQMLFYGMGGFVLGFATLKLAPFAGTLASVAGGLKIACSVFFLTVILGWLGYMLLIPTVFVQIVLLYKISEFIKDKTANPRED